MPVHALPTSTRLLGLIAGPISFFLILNFVHPQGLSIQANAILASTAWIAIWWITEAIPIAATSLLPIVLFPLTGGLSISETTASYGHYLIFLYIGGFIIAIAIERWNLHRRIALNIIRSIGTNISHLIFGFMIATAFLSMWISNTATVVMMLPIGLAIIKQLSLQEHSDEEEIHFIGKALMLAIAYSASIGGIATLIGTPPNLVLAAVVREIYQIEIDFTTWIIFGLPISILLLLICWQYLVKYAFPMKNRSFPGGRAEIQKQLEQLGNMSSEEKIVALVFALTALAWICRSFLLSPWLPAIDDTIIAIVGALILFVIPAPSRKGEAILDWESAVKLPWGILLLFGGGMALAVGFKDSGLAAFIGSQMNLLQGMALLLLLFILIAAVNFLTEITSNVATTSMLLPILAPIALTVDVHPLALMVGATVAASCAFMLPVATPPNAVVFGSGFLRIPDMVKTGIWMNIFSIIIVTLAVYFLLPLLWQIELGQFPVELKK